MGVVRQENRSLDGLTGSYLEGSTKGGRYRLVVPQLTRATHTSYEATAGDGGVYLIEVFRAVRPGVAEPFLAAAEELTKLEHAGLVPLIDAGASADFLFVVSPQLPGCTLARLLETVSLLSARVASQIVVQACRGLQTLHERGWAHGRIRPACLHLEQSSDGAVVPRWTGYAAEVLIRSEAVAAAPATPSDQDAFTAPELREGGRGADAAADVWSAAACLFWMLSGEPPRLPPSEPSPVDSSSGSLSKTWLQEDAPWLDDGLARVLSRALSLDPSARFPSAQALAEALSQFLPPGAELRADMLPPSVMDAHTHETRHAPAKSGSARKRGGVEGWPSSRPTSSKQIAIEAAFKGETLGGRWQIQQLLGSGGMGAVFEVIGEDGARAAAKIIRKDTFGDDDPAVRRFVQEARVAKSIDSPNVVRCFEVGHDDDLDAPFLIIELLHGCDLGQVIKRDAPLEPGVTARIFAQAARGLAAAHDRGVVHRDIKPSNLYLHRDEPSGPVTVKVCDFGVAKRLVATATQDTTLPNITQTGGVLGSPMYLSPEQALNAKQVDHRADVWSLCVSMYEALSGRKPWRHCSSLAEILVAICSQDVPQLTQVAPWTDPVLAKVVHKGLAREPDERWGSAAELAEVLEGYAGGETSFAMRDVVALDEEAREGYMIAEPSTVGLAGTHSAVQLELGSLSEEKSASLAPQRRGLSAIAPWAVAATLVAVGLVYSGIGQQPAEGVNDASASGRPEAGESRRHAAGRTSEDAQTPTGVQADRVPPLAKLPPPSASARPDLSAAPSIASATAAASVSASAAVKPAAKSRTYPRRPVAIDPLAEQK